MAISQFRSKRKSTGGRYKDLRKKRHSEKGSIPTHTKIGAVRKRVDRVRGSNTKSRLLMAEYANIFNPKTNKCVKAKILTATENPANPNYVRRNIINKGAVINTDKGKAKITSRPGQEGVINAVLIE